jgi:hypothetical protein
MPPQQEEPIIYERSKMSPGTKIGIGIVIVALLVVSAGAILNQSREIQIDEPVLDSEAALEAEVARILAEAPNEPFEYTAVPDAVNKISLPPPSVTEEVDAAVYAELKATTTVSEDVVGNDVIFNQSPLGISYIDFLNTLDDPTEIFQLTDELHQLTLHFNEQYKRPPLAERIQGVIQLAPLDIIVAGTETRSVYPSIRAVDAFLALEVMSRIDPANAAVYEATAMGVIKRGIGYGLYGQSDVDAAQSLVMQYMDLYTATSTVITDKI